MTDFKVQNKVTANSCEPSTPAPTPQQEEPCEGVLTGRAHGCLEIEGKVEMPCCCPQLRSQTFIVPINPQGIPQLQGFLQNTVTAYENQGYVILAHSLIDSGSGWVLGLTIGWYQ